ncbi:MAG: transglutaminase family protein [Planctomycetes bacterium]|nr:transglutaminase family protein [Planctomycetota bacterium]
MTSVEPRTLRALLELLLDDSPRVVAAAKQKLASMGDGGEKALREAATGDDARLRVRARQVLADLRRQQAIAKIHELARRPDEAIDLEEGVFLLAQVDYPELDRTPYTAILDALGEQLRQRVTARHPPYAVVLELSRLLSHEWRLRGNDEQFDDPDNSFVQRVLDRRKGIPISLAAVYLLVAKRAELPLHGVGAPGHYLLRYGPADWDLYLDPMTGRRLALDEAMRMLSVRGIPVTKENFTATRTRDTLVRMCANLATAYERRRNAAASHRWAELRDALRGSVA